MHEYRLKMIRRGHRGHRLFCQPGEQGWIVYYVTKRGKSGTYNDDPLTALGVLEAIDWMTRSDMAASCSVEEACACA